MIINGRETPPNIPMIRGFTPTRQSRQSIGDTVASAVSAAVKAMATQSPSVQSSSSGISSPAVGVSPSKVVDIRGKCLSQLGNLKQLLEDAVLTVDEWQEQKKVFLTHYESYKKLLVLV